MGMMLKELAAALGVSAATVTRNVQDGMPADSVEAARAWRAENCRARIAPPKPAAAALPVEVPTPAAPVAAPVPPPAAPVADVAGVEDYYVSRARREAAEAHLAELKLAEQQGRLVDREAVRSAHARSAVAFRDALLQLAARLAPLLVAESNQATIQRMLETEHRHALKQFAEGTTA